jgi:hypothetical protein
MSINRCCSTLLLGLTALGMTSWSSLSRPWKPTPTQMASDYAQIFDNRNKEIVFLRWWAPPTAQSGTTFAEIVEKYVLISVGHGHVNQPQGSMSFDSTDTLEARDSEGKPLVLIPKKDQPPTLIGAVSAMEATLRQSFGRLGDGVQFFVFNAGTVRACQKGKLSVLYANETYTWDTPFPGCNVADG